MKDIKVLVAMVVFLIMCLNHTPGYSQKDSDFSPWLYIQADKAVQHRFALVKEEGDYSYYKVQFRINYDSMVYDTTPSTEGYVVTFSYPGMENEPRVYKHLMIYKTYKGAYTMEGLMPIKTKFTDGYIRYFSNDNGFMFKRKNGEKGVEDIFYNCVDTKIVGSFENRCHGRFAWRYIFDEKQAVVLK